MRDAVLLVGLRRGDLVEAAEFELAVLEFVDRVGAPVHRVTRLATRASAPTPFIGEQHLRAIVVEGGRMPIGETGLGHVVDPRGLQRIGNVEHDAIARTCPGRDPLGREDGDVVAVIGDVRVLRAFAVVAAEPQAGNPFILGKDARGRGDPRCGGVRQWHLDHVNAEQRGVVATGFETACQFLVGTHVGGARIVDHDARVVRAHHRMRVAAAAGLHLADLHRTGDIGDVEDAQAAEPLIADALGYPAQPAIDARAAVLHAHEQQVADDRHVALPAGTDDRADEIRHAVLAEAIGIEAVIAAGDQQVAREGHVGIGEAQQRGTLAETVFLLAVFAFLAAPGRAVVLIGGGVLILDRGLELRGVLRIEESGRLGQSGDLAQIADCLARIAETGGQADARIARQLRQQHVHPLDFGFLVGNDVVGELEHDRIVGAARLAMQFLDHLDRALVVADHQRQELAVELGPLRFGQRFHLRRRRHPHHRVMRVMIHRSMVHPRMMRLRLRARSLAPRLEPAAHESDLVGLRAVDPVGDGAHRVIAGPLVHERRHFHRLQVMDDHILHELHIGRRIARVGQADGLVLVDHARLRARRARQHDRCLLRDRGTCGGQKQAGGQHPKTLGHIGSPQIFLAHTRPCAGPGVKRQFHQRPQAVRQLRVNLPRRGPR